MNQVNQVEMFNLREVMIVPPVVVVEPVVEAGSDAEFVLADPSVSYWLKGAIKSAITRDPVDALNDAKLLVRVLKAEAAASRARLTVVS